MIVSPIFLLNLDTLSYTISSIWHIHFLEFHMIEINVDMPFVLEILVYPAFHGFIVISSCFFCCMMFKFICRLKKLVWSPWMWRL